MRAWQRIQWNLSNPDTLGTEESVLISEVWLKIQYLGQQRFVFIEVSLF